jgi:hypothetical protein
MKNRILARIVACFLVLVAGLALVGCDHSEEQMGYYIPGKDTYRGKAPALPCVPVEQASQYLSYKGCLSKVEQGPWQIEVNGTTQCQYRVSVLPDCIEG